jgi:type IV pilus assembly protein PilP
VLLNSSSTLVLRKSASVRSFYLKMWILLMTSLPLANIAWAQEGEGNSEAAAGRLEPSTDQSHGTSRQSLISQLVPPYPYDPRGRRDPFAPPLIERPLGELPKHGPFLPLQSLDLGKVKVRAILWDVQNPRALIQSPDGSVHNVGLSDRLGGNNGYVASIREGEVVLVETFEEDGRVFSTTRVLPINK